MNLKINVTGNPNRLHLNLRKKTKQCPSRCQIRIGFLPRRHSEHERDQTEKVVASDSLLAQSVAVRKHRISFVAPIYEVVCLSPSHHDCEVYWEMRNITHLISSNKRTT